jgi:hypothetical protein
VDGDLLIEYPVIEPFQFEMIHRVNLVAEIFQGTDQATQACSRRGGFSLGASKFRMG